MPDSASLLTFTAAALVVLLIPGPGVLYIVARSVTQGRRAGIVSVLGLSAGALVHVLAATIGLSAILLASATAFNVVKLLGAAYLIWLGLNAIFGRRAEPNAGTAMTRSAAGLFWDGVIISVFNPKIAVFFLAFLPQFVSSANGPVPQQILFLGFLYIAIALVTDGAYALLAGSVRGWLSSLIRRPLTRVASGTVYIGLGVMTALTERRS